MSVFGITLLVIGVIIFAVSFFIPDKEEKMSRREKEKQLEKQQEEIRRMMEKELDGMKLRVNEATNETVEYGMDRVERSLEKISNEKIMAVNDYSATIIEEMDNRHKEIMFLYDMLNDKQVDIKNTVRKAEATAKEVNDAAKIVQESYDAAQMEFERQISEQTIFLNNYQEEPVMPQEPVLYHANIDESIFDNMRRDDLPVSNVVDTGRGMPEVTSLFNSAMTNNDQEVFERDIKLEQLVKDEIKETTDNTDDYRDAMFVSEGNNNQKILSLYNQGMQVVDIARELNLGVGEVKLVIDLFR